MRSIGIAGILGALLVVVAGRARGDEPAPDGARMRLAYSAMACAAASDRREATTAIAEEHRRAHAAGVLNLSLLQSLKQDVATADQNLSEAKQGLRELHAKPLPCRDVQVATLVSCLGDHSGTGCDEPAVSVAWTLVRKLLNGT